MPSNQTYKEGIVKYYTGIGSRETPEDIQSWMKAFAIRMQKHGYTLRSGGAGGADSAFEQGCGSLGEIWLPWNKFNNKFEGGIYKLFPSSKIEQECMKIASEIHPVWKKLSHGAKKLHARNILQVLGSDLQTPSELLVCWATMDKNGKVLGGTATAWNLAMKLNIPCYNLFIPIDGHLVECVFEEQ